MKRSIFQNFSFLGKSKMEGEYIEPQDSQDHFEYFGMLLF